MSACATMMAGSSDSGSTLLMMVMSAGGSWRAQPETRVKNSSAPQLKQRKRARQKNCRARFERNMGYFAGTFVAGALVSAVSGRVSRLFFGAAAGGGGAAIGAVCCICCTCFSNAAVFP